MSDIINVKQRLGEQAVTQFVRSDMSIGLGSGTTAIWAIKSIAQKYHSGELKNICCTTTGPGTQLEALQYKLPIFDPNHPSVQSLDLCIDGADEFDDESNLTKGGGGCLLLEKIIGYSAKKFIILVTESKKVEHLGLNFPLPIEVIPAALKRVESRLKATYNIIDIKLRLDANKIGPWITEQGNYLLDIKLGHAYNPKILEKELVQIVGIVEVGFFTQHRPLLLIARDNGEIITKI